MKPKHSLFLRLAAGIDLDAANARKIAVAMGLPPLNMSEISNPKLTRSLDVMAKDARGPQVLYIAASNDTQEVEATGSGDGGSGRYGASEVVTVSETVE